MSFSSPKETTKAVAEMSRDVATKSLHVTLAQGSHEYQGYFTEQYMQNGKNGRCAQSCHQPSPVSISFRLLNHSYSRDSEPSRLTVSLAKLLN